MARNAAVADSVAAHWVFRLNGVGKTWLAPDKQFQLWVPQLNIRAGAQIAVLGRSGCGKSTLLDILAMTLEPDVCGTFSFAPHEREGIDIGKVWGKRRLDRLAGLRGRHIGYVLQTGGLLPFLTVRDNIELPRQVCGMAREDATEMLAERLNISDQLDKLPGALSVGQRQRAAVARALAHEPTVILADEPTASLDPQTAGEVMELVVSLAAQRNITLVVASHDWQGVTDLGMVQLQHKQVEGTGKLRSVFQT
ncbi:MAG: ATP-binding cassette domain-containing protein [Gammaproteobacteria bacterium]|nr:ATP-binding cassette domain-containing protein [Gammaproteobacteria bacterium]